MFCSVPFGMNPGGMSAWYSMGGPQVWEETYAAFTSSRALVRQQARKCGWFRKKINTIADYRG